VKKRTFSKRYPSTRQANGKRSIVPTFPYTVSYNRTEMNFRYSVRVKAHGCAFCRSPDGNGQRPCVHYDNTALNIGRGDRNRFGRDLQLSVLDGQSVSNHKQTNKITLYTRVHAHYSSRRDDRVSLSETHFSKFQHRSFKPSARFIRFCLLHARMCACVR